MSKTIFYSTFSQYSVAVQQLMLQSDKAIAIRLINNPLISGGRHAPPPALRDAYTQYSKCNVHLISTVLGCILKNLYFKYRKTLQHTKSNLKI